MQVVLECTSHYIRLRGKAQIFEAPLLWSSQWAKILVIVQGRGHSLSPHDETEVEAAG